MYINHTNSPLKNFVASAAVVMCLLIMTSLQSTAGQWEAQPVPEFGYSLIGIWGSGADNVYVVGSSKNAVLQYNGTHWSEVETPTRTPLNGIWGSSADNIFAVGNQGPILHFDGNQWIEQETSLPTYPPSELYGVSGLNDEEVFAVGKYSRQVGSQIDNSIILRYDGQRWYPMDDPTLNALLGISEVAGKLYAVGSQGTILVYDQQQRWTSMESGTTAFLTSVWGNSADSVFAVGGAGTILHFDGNDWSFMQSGTNEALWHVWGSSPQNVYAVGYSGTLLHFDGQIWTILDSETINILRGIWGSSANNVFAVGGKESILHYNGVNWSRMEGVSRLDILDIWPTSPGKAFATGRVSREILPYGVILKLENRNWSQSKYLPEDFPKALWAHSADDVFVVGVGKGSSGNPNGMVLHYDGNEWQKMETPPVNPLFAVWGSSSDNVFAVGSEGIILHFDGSNWSIMESGTFFNLRGVWGSSATDVFAVGSGVILQYDGQAWQSMDNPTENTLLDVWGSSASDVVAVGEQGTIIHFDGASWTPMIAGSSTNYTGVWGASPQDIYVVGEGGIIRHYNGNRWPQEDSGTESLLHSVQGVLLDTLGHHAFVGGTNGAILHRSRYTYASQPGTVQLPKTGQITSYAPDDDGDIQTGLVWPEPRFSNNGDGTVTDNLTGLMWLFDGGCLGRMSWHEAMETITDFNSTANAFSCTGYNGNYNDWRLPNAGELESLVDVEYCSTGFRLIELGAFENFQHVYWSSTTFDYNHDYAWRVDIGGLWDVGRDDPWVMCNGGIMNLEKDFSGNPQHYQIPAVLAVRGKSTGPAQLWKTGQETSYTPGGDGSFQLGVSWPDPRFKDNNDGTVTDNLTGLMWLQDPLCFGNQTWDNALALVRQFNNDPSEFACKGHYASYNDWRLANRKELQSLLDFSTSNQALPSGYKDVFPRLDTGGRHHQFWTSSTLNHCNGTDAFNLQPHAQIRGGRIIGFWEKSREFQVWPVRGSPTLFVAPGSHDFNSIPVGNSSEPLVITISNRNTLEAAVSGMNLSDPENFVLNVNGGSNPCGSTIPTLAPNESCSLELTFTPQQSGTFSEKLLLQFAGENEQNFTVALHGFSPHQLGGPCFLVKAVQGTPLADKIDIFREIRDKHLRTNRFGRYLVNIYYALSPLIAAKMDKHQSLQIVTYRTVAFIIQALELEFKQRTEVFRQIHIKRESQPLITSRTSH